MSVFIRSNSSRDEKVNRDLCNYPVKEEDQSLRYFSDELFNGMIHEFDINGESQDSENTDENFDMDGEENSNSEGKQQEETPKEDQRQNSNSEEEQDNDENFELPEDDDENNEGDQNQETPDPNDDSSEEEEDNDENFDMDGEENSEESSEEEPDSETEDLSSDIDDVSSKLKELETIAFADLNDAEKSAKTNELKNIYTNIYDKCKVLADKTNDIRKDDSTIQIIEYIRNSLTDLRQYILDYIETIFDSKSYVENLAQVQKYIAVLSSVNTIFVELKKDFVE